MRNIRLVIIFGDNLICGKVIVIFYFFFNWERSSFEFEVDYFVLLEFLLDMMFDGG